MHLPIESEEFLWDTLLLAPWFRIVLNIALIRNRFLLISLCKLQSQAFRQTRSLKLPRSVRPGEVKPLRISQRNRRRQLLLDAKQTNDQQRTVKTLGRNILITVFSLIEAPGLKRRVGGGASIFHL